MKSVRLSVLALTGLLAAHCGAATITQNFATDPQLAGWQVFGDTNLFQWNAANQNLAVTWDSSKPNSYFHLPLNTILTRNDDFSIEFDLVLNDIAGGVEPGTTGPLQIGFGFLNQADATSTNFERGGWGSAPNVVEFNYYPWGYFDWFGTIYDSPASAPPALIPASGYIAAPTHPGYYNIELPTNQPIHVAMTFTASNQTVVLSVTTNGALVQFPDIVLTETNNSAFTGLDDYRVNIFSVSSYSSIGADMSSVFGHGTVDNLTVTVPPPPVRNFTGIQMDSIWQGQFIGRSNWLYTLERTTDFLSWTNVSPTISGIPGNLALQDTNPAVSHAFYRVRADLP